jgi:uncharacterized Zn-binding protein involved in type VI secretion
MPEAARLGDFHRCPMYNGDTPHVGGPVLTSGCPTVLIGSMQAACLGDTCSCAGPPDMIAQGSSTVLFGGLPAARVGDATLHNGSIITGFFTVIIGG